MRMMKNLSVFTYIFAGRKMIQNYHSMQFECVYLSYIFYFCDHIYFEILLMLEIHVDREYKMFIVYTGV